MKQQVHNIYFDDTLHALIIELGDGAEYSLNKVNPGIGHMILQWEKTGDSQSTARPYTCSVEHGL